MSPQEALEQIAYLLETQRAPTYKVQAFRRALEVIGDLSERELSNMAKGGELRRLPGVGASTEAVIREALDGITPSYLSKLLGHRESPLVGEAADMRSALRGDCHGHTTWSDGGSSIEAMARAAMALGHEYWSLTDHSARLTVAHGLDAQRLGQQLEELEEVNAKLADEGHRFRVLSGMEVDILEDGSLDMEPEMLSRLDVVVGSVHSKLSMEAGAMTERMIRAVTSPHVDILGHCTGRIIVGRGRKQSRFDADRVLSACVASGTALEINCRPERLDPPMRILRAARDMGCHFSIDTDAHAPGQLEWLRNGCERAAECGIRPEQVVNSWKAEELLSWTATHEQLEPR